VVFLAGFEQQAAFQLRFKIHPVSPLQCGCFLALLKIDEAQKDEKVFAL
jgi:hypothetical protein